MVNELREMQKTGERVSNKRPLSEMTVDKELLGLHLEDKLSKILFEQDSSDSDELEPKNNKKPQIVDEEAEGMMEEDPENDEISF